MGSMRLGELSVVGKMIVFMMICAVVAGGYYGYISHEYNLFVEQGNESLVRGDYSDAVSAYNSALEVKSFGGSRAEIASLINNVNKLKESEIARVQQEIVAVIGDKYGGIEGANTIAIRKGYYAAVEIVPVQEKIDRLKTLNVNNNITRQYQQVLDSQKKMAKGNNK